MRRCDRLEVEVVRLAHGSGLPLPDYQTGGAAGLDLYAALPEGETVVLEPGDRRLVGCGFKMAVPMGWVGFVFARSGTALKGGLALANGVGVIDSDYRGEVGCILANQGRQAVGLTRGLRLAQLVVMPVARVEWLEMGDLDDTVRGSKGFGSTGAT